MRTIIADTGPIVAMLNRRDQFHTWAADSLKTIQEPLHTCEAVLTEVFFRLSHVPRGQDQLLDLLTEPDVIVLNWRLDNNRVQIKQLLKKYADTPASFADTCLVSIAASSSSPLIWTTDRHFEIYRLPGGKRIPLLVPERLQ
jgi:predicted nucleic acid-binding protein